MNERTHALQTDGPATQRALQPNILGQWMFTTYR